MSKFYYLSPQNEQQGPVEAFELKDCGVTETTLVWTRGMAQWMPAGEVDELASLFAPAVEDVPPVEEPPMPAVPQYVEQPTPQPVPQPAPQPMPQYVPQPTPQPTPQPAPQPAPQPTPQPAAGSYNKSEHSNSAYQQEGAPQSGEKPNNNMIFAILSTVLCCLPLGVYAIICANKVDGLYAAGDYAGAVEQANAAKKWSIISAAAAAVAYVIYFVVMIIAAVAGN